MSLQADMSSRSKKSSARVGTTAWGREARRGRRRRGETGWGFVKSGQWKAECRWIGRMGTSLVPMRPPPLSGLHLMPAWEEWRRSTFFFWSMLRSSSQLWQSCNCAKIVIGRQLDRKDWSATWESKQETQTQQPQQANKQSPQVLTNLWKGETSETGSRSHYLVQNTMKNPGSHNLFSCM